MKTTATLIAAIVAALCGTQSALAQYGQSSQPARTPPEQLGKVHFVTSCNPAVEQRFIRAMALLHSFWAKEAI